LETDHPPWESEGSLYRKIVPIEAAMSMRKRLFCRSEPRNWKKNIRVMSGTIHTKAGKGLTESVKVVKRVTWEAQSECKGLDEGD